MIIDREVSDAVRIEDLPHVPRPSASHPQKVHGCHTGLFKKHGIKVCDFFENADGEETIYYICEFADRPQRDAAFAAFGADPEWKAAYARSHEDGGPIVERVESIFMNRVPYIKPVACKIGRASCRGRV